MKARIRSAGDTDPGRMRRNNEDAFHLDPDRGIFFVVDGIGGQAAGEHAAAIAVERVRARLERQTGTTEQRIREAITVANNEILQTAQSNPEWDGMACVLTIAVLENGSAVIGHVGDSRLYYVRGSAIRKITHDHSPVGEREDSRELTEDEAMRHPRRNEVYRDVGSEEHSPDDPDWIEVQRITFEPDAALVLCSDGLSDQVGSREILETVARNAGDPDRSVHDLIDAANRAGGKDNVTVLVVEGEQFAAAEPVAQRQPPAGVRSSHILWLVVGILLGLAAGYAAGRWLFAPAPVASAGPHVLSVGNGQEYARIGLALAAAVPGDTVEVFAGEYREQIRLRDSIALRSHVPREAVLMPVAGADSPVVIADTVHYARISGFLVRADEQTPLSAAIVLRNSEVAVQNLEITGARTGIQIEGGSPTLLGNSIHDCLGDGVVVAGGGTPWVLHNSMQRNKGAGLVIREGARPALVGNVFEKNAVDLPRDLADTLRDRNFLLTPPRTGTGRKQ